jgi:hypothetical protein
MRLLRARSGKHARGPRPSRGEKTHAALEGARASRGSLVTARHGAGVSQWERTLRACGRDQLNCKGDGSDRRRRLARCALPVQPLSAGPDPRHAGRKVGLDVRKGGLPLRANLLDFRQLVTDLLVDVSEHVHELLRIEVR